jgi:hypothetical protein
MALELLERPATNAQAPMHRLARQPVQPITPIYHSGSFGLWTTITSTSSGYHAVFVDAGTMADPTCRLYMPGGYPARTTANDVLEIRFLSGLTWEELGKLFCVSRRSIHNWANGETLKASNVILVSQALAAIRALHRPSSTETRLALLTRLASGGRPLDLLRARRWEEAISAVASLPPFPVPPSPHPEPTQLHPTAYFGALSDSPGPTSGRLVRSRRLQRRTS